jgi:hypothetical protein
MNELTLARSSDPSVSVLRPQSRNWPSTRKFEFVGPEFPSRRATLLPPGSAAWPWRGVPATSPTTCVRALLRGAIREVLGRRPSARP